MVGLPEVYIPLHFKGGALFALRIDLVASGITITLRGITSNYISSSTEKALGEASSALRANRRPLGERSIQITPVKSPSRHLDKGHRRWSYAVALPNPR
jgi:hypothetical protein